MWDVLKGLAGGDEESWAADMQRLSVEGGFDPRELLIEEQRPIAAFLGPLGPSLRHDIAAFVDSGSGPFQALVEQWEQEGVARAEAVERARTLLTSTRGACVVVCDHQPGLGAVVRLYGERIDEAYGRWLVASMSPEQRPVVTGLVHGLLECYRSGVGFPASVTAVGPGRPAALWQDLARRLLADTGPTLRSGQQAWSADLAWWIAEALRGLGADADADTGVLVVRCLLYARRPEEAVARLPAVFAAGIADEDCLALIEELVAAAIAAGCPEAAGAAVATHHADLLRVFGGPCYELSLAQVRCLAAAAAPAEDLITAIEELQQADRKAFRHDLQREPIWVVVGDDPGALLDTATAAERIGRSVQFVEKRLERGTIPVYHCAGDQLRIPARALDAWIAVMDHFALLD